MKRYDSYKDSGVQWIGEIPSHWDVCTFKRFMTINNGSDYKHIVSDEGFPVIGSGGPFATASQYMYDGEVVMLGRKGTIDKPMYFNGKFWAVDTMFYAIPSKEANCRFMYYLALTFPFNYYSTATALPSMTQTDLGNNPVAVPDLAEQSAIATYLDNKCSKIDNIIATQEKRVELLRELKQSIITRAVTRGINPEAKMKDSGVEWIGEIPEHWDVMPIKRLSRIQTGTTPSTKVPEYFEPEEIKWFTPSDVTDDLVMTSASRFVSNKAKQDGACRIFPPKSIYFVGIGATIGKVGVCDEEASSNQQINALMVNKKANYKYLAYILRCQKDEIYLSANVVTLPIINQEKTGELLSPVPPIDEQEAIVTYIEQQTNKLDNSITKALRQIELLKEYKQSLITEVVTGKRKVC